MTYTDIMLISNKNYQRKLFILLHASLIKYACTKILYLNVILIFVFIILT